MIVANHPRNRNPLMPVATLPSLAVSLINDGLQKSLSYAERLLKDIPAANFAYMPHPGMNHPAFIIGHLSLYPNRLLNMIGRTDLLLEKPKYPELFQAGSPCVEQDGRYPAKDELVTYYFERYRTFSEILPTLTDDLLQRENPMEGRMKEFFPKIGFAISFLLNNHQSLHLGQISAWRRAVGMGPA